MHTTITYQLLSPDDIPEAAQVIAHYFVSLEPMYQCIDIPRDTYELFARGYLHNAAAEHLSFVARDSVSGAIAGVVVAGDLTKNPFDNLSELDEVFQNTLAPDFALLEELEKRYLAQHPFHRGECLHIHQAIVVPKHQGKGIATGLLRQAVQAGTGRNFTVAISDCTGPASVKAHEKAGFTPAGVLTYKDFTYRGVAVYASLPGACVLMEKYLK